MSDDYHEEQAKAYNAVGAVHHDPRVRNQQRMQGHLVSEPTTQTSSGNEEGTAGLIILALCAIPLIPFFYLYVGLRESIIRHIFQQKISKSNIFSQSGLIFDNVFVDMLLVLSTIILASFFLSKHLGYVIAIAFLTIVSFASANRVGFVPLIIPIAFYILYWMLGHSKVPFGWLLTSVIITISTLASLAPHSYYGIFLRKIEYVGFYEAYSAAGKNALIGALFCLLFIYVLSGISWCINRICGN